MTVSPALLNYFKDYDNYHRTWGNKVTHYIGVPLILITTLGLMAQLNATSLGFQGYEVSEFIRVDGGTVLLGLAILRYLMLDFKITIPFSFCLVGCYFLGRALPPGVLWTLFIAGWIAQFIGHYYYEKKSPAFFKNLEQILIGPLWIFSRWVGYYP